MDEICFEPAYRLAQRLRERSISSLELLARFEERFTRLNPRINAIVATNFQQARQQAKQADEALARGERRPLLGVPMTIKDSLEVAGMPTVCGAPALRDYRPRTNAVAVQRLLDAGAVIFGKTNVPLYAGDVQTFNKVYGTTNNPWNTERTPGGSSGGAAAALAAGLTALELGSDIGGSIRTPAHFCGVLGHKPSSGLVPSRGHIPGPPGTVSEPDLSTVGPLARHADDLELALKLIAGPLEPAASAWRVELPKPHRASLREYRVAAWFEDPACPIDSAVRDALEAAVEKLRQAGCSVTIGAPAGFSLEEMFELYFSLLCAVFAGGLPEKLYRRARFAGQLAHWAGRARVNTLPGFLYRATGSHREWLRLHEQRERLRLKFEAFFGDTDVLLLPVTPTAAPPHLQKGDLYSRKITVNGRPQAYASQFVWIGPATAAGLPATSAPVGQTPDRLPVGVQIVSGYGRDLTTIDFARRLGRLLGGFQPPPSF